MCGSAQIAPRPAAMDASSRSAPRKSVRSRIASGPITGSRKTSRQYRAYERSPRCTRASSSASETAGPTTRRRFARSRRLPLPSRRAATSAATRNAAAATGCGTALTAAQPAAYPASTIRGAHSRGRPAAPALPLAPRALALEGVTGLPGPRPACRRTSTSRCTTVIADSATSAQSATAWTYGTPRPSSPVPARAMVSRCGRSTRPTSQRSPAPSARAFTYETRAPRIRQSRQASTSGRDCPRPGEPPQQRAEDGRVGDPVEAGVEHRAEAAGAAAGPGHRAVDHVEHREEPDHQVPTKNSPRVKKTQRAADRAERADDGDGVGGDPAPGERARRAG